MGINHVREGLGRRQEGRKVSPRIEGPVHSTHYTYSIEWSTRLYRAKWKKTSVFPLTLENNTHV